MNVHMHKFKNKFTSFLSCLRTFQALSRKLFRSIAHLHCSTSPVIRMRKLVRVTRPRLTLWQTHCSSAVEDSQYLLQIFLSLFGWLEALKPQELSNFLRWWVHFNELHFCPRQLQDESLLPLWHRQIMSMENEKMDSVGHPRYGVIRRAW